MKDKLIYKNYIGSVHFSAEDDIFYGKVEDIRDLISFEGETVKALKKDFHEAVDDYIDVCKRIGKEPSKPYSGTFNVRVGKGTHQAAARIAMIEGVSLNKFVEGAIMRIISGRSKATTANKRLAKTAKKKAG